MNITEEEIASLKSKQFNISCCRSYLSPKGRCYTCPDDMLQDPDEEKC